MLGKALKGRRDEVVVATKFHLPMGDDVNARGNSRRWIMRAVEGSLKRLQTDYIDLYQAHRPDGDVEETLSALTDLVRAGKVRYLGSSTFPASQIVEAQWVSKERRLERFVCEQPPYSILVRGIEHDVLPTTLRHGMGVIPWSPLAGGWLSGRYRKGASFTSRRMEYMRERFDHTLPHNARKFEVADALGTLADEAGIPLVELALAWVINHPASRRRSSGRARSSTSRASCPRRHARWTARCWTGSMRSSRPARTSAQATTATTTRRWKRRRAEVDGAGRPSGPPGVACLSRLVVERTAAVRAACPLHVALAPQAKAAKASDSHRNPPF